MSKYGAKWPVLAKQWDRMKISADKVDDYQRAARKVLANKQRYVDIQAATHVPWPLIAALHMRESDFNWNTYLGNGEPLSRKTRLVPRGRGPFPNFEAGAIDALHYDSLDDVRDWRLEKMLWHAEKFNGFGYEKHNKPSPYVWSGTSIQERGKFVSDGRWSSTAWDTQLGVAGLIKTLAEMDSSIVLTRET